MYAMTLVFTSTAIMSGKPFEGRAEEYDSVLSLSIFCKQDDIGMNSFLFPQSLILKVFFKEDGNSSINPVRKFWGTTFFLWGWKKKFDFVDKYTHWTKLAEIFSENPWVGCG